MSGNSNTDILVAGAVAAFTVDLLVYPLDTLKTRIQSPDYTRLFTHAATQKPNPALFRGLYQGVGSVIIATLPAWAFFTTYERTKALLHGLNPPTCTSPNGFIPTPLIHAGASSLAELVACAIITPAEVIKQNAQMVTASSSSSNPNVNATLHTLSKFKSNPLALWRGYTALAGRNLPFTALQFPMFEKLREMIKRDRERRGLATGSMMETGLVTAFSAGSAGSVAAVITTPVDVVKTRIMLSAVEDAGGHASARAAEPAKGKGALVDALGKSVESPKVTIKEAAKALNPLVKRKKRKSSWMIGKEIVAEKGLQGLWRGGALRGFWTFVGSGLYLGVYDCGRIYLAGRRGEKVDESELM